MTVSKPIVTLSVPARPRRVPYGPERLPVHAMAPRIIDNDEIGAHSLDYRAGFVTPDAAPSFAQTVTRESFASVTPDDVAAIRREARAYCLAIDATRSRKRAADAWEDVAHDAVLMLAELLGKARGWDLLARGDYARPHGASDPMIEWQLGRTDSLPAHWTTPDASDLAPVAWRYLRRFEIDGMAEDVACECDADACACDDPTIGRKVTRGTLYRWAIHDAARRNGFRVPVAAVTVESWETRDDTGATVKRSQSVTVGAQLVGVPNRIGQEIGSASIHAQIDATSMREAWNTALAECAGPELRATLFAAIDTDGRRADSWISRATAACYGGTGASPRQTARLRERAREQFDAVRAYRQTLTDAVGVSVPAPSA